MGIEFSDGEHVRRVTRAASEATKWPRTLAQLLIVAALVVPVLLHGTRPSVEGGGGLAVLGALVLWPTMLRRQRLITEAVARAPQAPKTTPDDGPVLVEFASCQPSSPIGSRQVALRRQAMRRTVTRVALGGVGAAAVLVLGVAEALIVLVVFAVGALIWLLLVTIGLLGQRGTLNRVVYVPDGRERIYTITATALRVSDGDRSTRWPWSAVVAVAEWPETYVLTARNGASFALPRDTMTAEQEECLAELIRLSTDPGSPRTSREGSPARRT